MLAQYNVDTTNNYIALVHEINDYEHLLRFQLVQEW